jgi:hypothetical protein
MIRMELTKHKRVTGPARDEIAAQLRKDYENGTTLRDLAASSGRSYGFVHRMLTRSRSHSWGFPRSPPDPR